MNGDDMNCDMNCDDARKLVDDLLDGRLAVALEAKLREHAASCPACASALGAADVFAADVSASFFVAGEAAPVDMPKRIMRAVAGEGARNVVMMRRIAWIGAATVAAAAAVAVIALSLPATRLPKNSPKSNPEDVPVAGIRDTAPVREGAVTPFVEVATLAAGKLEVRRAGSDETTTPEAGAPLAAGDVVRATGEEPCELLLADGSRVFLRSGAKAVLAPPGGGARTIRLDSGSVFAEVEKDAEPFVVATALGNVTTLGTKFGVSLDARDGGVSELAVVVEEGAVRVESDAGRRVVRAGEGCLYGGGERQCGMSGEQSRGRFGWMERHRERRRQGRAHGEGGAGRCMQGDGKDPQGRGHRRSGPAGEMRQSGSGHESGSKCRSGSGRGAEGGRGLDAGKAKGKDKGERLRVNEKRRTEEKKRAQARERAEGRRRAEEKKRLEEKRRVEEKLKEEQRRRDEAGQHGGGQSGKGGGGRGNAGGGRDGRSGRNGRSGRGR